MGDVKLNRANENKEHPPTDFEAAIEATGYGYFNYLLLLVGMPSCIATHYETSTISFLLPSAECDLHLQLNDKGLLNAVTYAGTLIIT